MTVAAAGEVMRYPARVLPQVAAARGVDYEVGDEQHRVLVSHLAGTEVFGQPSLATAQHFPVPFFLVLLFHLLHHDKGLFRKVSLRDFPHLGVFRETDGGRRDCCSLRGLISSGNARG